MNMTPFWVGLVALVTLALAATETLANEPASTNPSDLDALVADAVRRTQFQLADADLKDEQVAVTVIDLSDPAKPRTGRFRGDAPIYPASVVKLFYLAATHRWLEDGKLAV